MKGATIVVLLLVVVPVAHAAMLHVASNGVDGGSCGPKKTPCRSITQAIQNASAGDDILVGPGAYKGETGALNCNCYLAVNKPVVILSTDGAASTIIDATSFMVQTSVLVTAAGSEFGRPGKGFTVTNPDAAGGVGIAVEANDVQVRGNQVLADDSVADASTGIASSGNPVAIEGNQVMFWHSLGISGVGEGTTVRGNQVSRNATGILASGQTTATGNVVSDNRLGIQVDDAATVVGNAVYGNSEFGLDTTNALAQATITRNDIVGNGDPATSCGIHNPQVAGLDATNNYWGAASGPGPPPANGPCDVAPGTTTTSPFASKPFKVKVRIKP